MKKKTNNNKPITYVTTYRGVRGHSPGLYQGKNRDVLIAGEDFSNTRSIRKISTDQAKSTLSCADHSIRELLPRIDEMYVYLGASGASPGFEYIKKHLDGNGNKKIKIVACDCDTSSKQRFAEQNNLPIIWAECGWMDTLEEIVKSTLEQ